MKDKSEKMNLSKWLNMKDNFQKESRMSAENESKLIEKNQLILMTKNPIKK